MSSDIFDIKTLHPDSRVFETSLTPNMTPFSLHLAHTPIANYPPFFKFEFNYKLVFLIINKVNLQFEDAKVGGDCGSWLEVLGVVSPSEPGHEDALAHGRIPHQDHYRITCDDANWTGLDYSGFMVLTFALPVSSSVN